MKVRVITSDLDGPIWDVKVDQIPHRGEYMLLADYKLRVGMIQWVFNEENELLRVDLLVDIVDKPE